MKLLVLSIVVLLSLEVFSQNLPIVVDGVTDEWTDEPVYDEVGDGASLDLICVRVSSDNDNLYLTLKTYEEFSLGEKKDLELLIDTDCDKATGVYCNGIGADIVWQFGSRKGSVVVNGRKKTVRHSDVGFVALPSVSSNEFEMSFSRNSKVGGVSLFPNDKIRLTFRVNEDYGDEMPEPIYYEFVTSQISCVDTIPLERISPDHLRLMTWNVLGDGLIDQSRVESFRRVLTAVSPDIVTFNECWDATASDVRQILDEAVPLTDDVWYVRKTVQGNITASRFPILKSCEVKPGSRISAHIIDLPKQMFNGDLVVFNCHLKCCSSPENDATRQNEVDALMQFVNNMKDGTNAFSVERYTPFVFMGDFNFVGSSQNLKTIVTGDIQNSSLYGESHFPDWDGSEMKDDNARNVARNSSYTYSEQDSYYWSSRLDYVFYTGSVMQVQKSFILQTSLLGESQLLQYGLKANDNTIASDHLPHVTDFTFGSMPQSVEDDMTNSRFHCPGIVDCKTEFSIECYDGKDCVADIYDVTGRKVQSAFLSGGQTILTISKPGLYLIGIQGTFDMRKIIVK